MQAAAQVLEAERRAAARRMDELSAAAGQVKREREAVILRLQMSAQQMQRTIVEQTKTEAPGMGVRGLPTPSEIRRTYYNPTTSRSHRRCSTPYEIYYLAYFVRYST